VKRLGQTWGELVNFEQVFRSTAVFRPKDRDDAPCFGQIVHIFDGKGPRNSEALRVLVNDSVLGWLSFAAGYPVTDNQTFGARADLNGITVAQITGQQQFGQCVL